MGVMEWRGGYYMSPVQNRSLPQQKIYTKQKNYQKKQKNKRKLKKKEKKLPKFFNLDKQVKCVIFIV